MEQSVTFVAGTAKLDVSERVRAELLSLVEKSGDTDRNIVYIVPEQFEYEAEHIIYRLLNEKGLLTKSRRIKTTTFSALSKEILEQAGETRPIADDIVKSIVMRKAIRECKLQLRALGGICDKPGFTQKILSTIDGLKAVGLDSRSLEESLETIISGNALSQSMLLLEKLKDVSLLYTAYTSMLAEYLDAPDLAELAAGHLVKSGILNDKFVFVDNFNDFTAGQMSFLKQMITAANSVMFAFTTDVDSDNEVFATANSNIRAIRAAAAKCEITSAVITDGIPSRIAAGSPLCELSDKIFTDKRSTAPAGDSIQLISASDVYEELDFVCSKIIELVDKKQFRYNNIAVLCTDLGTYQRYAESAFKKYDIPIFLDYREPILHQPLVNCIIATLRALEDFSVDTALSCIKTGFFSKYDDEKKKRVGLSDSDINIFENYVYEWAIETDHLKKEFTFHNKNLPEDCNMKTAESVRKYAVEPLWETSQAISKRSGKDKIVNGAEFTKLLYDFLMDTVGLKRALIARSMTKDGKDSETTEHYQRLWDTILNIFEALYAELKDVELSVKEYGELFRGLCAETTLSSPPQMVDNVLVGDIDRTRAEGIRAVFIVGATYDLFPTPAAQSGIFSEYENELIHENLKLASDDSVGELRVKSAREQFSLALYRAYKALTLPTDHLCLTCPEMTGDGDGTELSEVIERCGLVFGDLKIRRASSFGNEFYCRSERAAKYRFAMNMGVDSDENAILREALIENDCKEFVDKLKEIRTERFADANSDEIGKHEITPENARLLFPRKIGATAIEKLSTCGFKYYAEYGLGIREKNQRSFNPTRRGDAIHYVLEKIIGKYSGDIALLCKLERSDLQTLARRCLEEYCEQETNNTFADDPRSRFLFNNIANSAADVLISMQAEFYARGYRPKFFELDLNRSNEKKYIPENDDTLSAPLPSAELYSDGETAPPEPEKAVSSKKYILAAPLTIDVDPSLKVVITGRIDRIDMFTVSTGKDEKTYVRAVDYKSSAHSFNLFYAANGINIQMLLYLIALLDANKNNPTVNLAAGGLSYIPSKSSGALNDENSAFRLLALNHLESSLLVKDENTEKDLNEYADFVLERIAESDGKKALLEANPDDLSEAERKELDEYRSSLKKLRGSFETNKFNCVDAEKFDEMRNDLIAGISKKLENLYKGDISAMPLCHNEKSVNKFDEKKSYNIVPCEYCIFGGICKNAGKKLIKAGDPEKDWENKYISSDGK